MASDKLFTPEALASYPYLFTPQAPMPDKDGKITGQPSYTVTLIFTTEAQKSPRFIALKAAALAALQEEWGNGVKDGKQKLTLEEALRKGVLKTPFRTDWEKQGYPEGSVFIVARRKESFGPPGIVSTIPDPNNINPATGRPRPMMITDQKEIYPGVIVVASVTPYTYDRNGNKGVSFGLGNIQKIRDSERLDSHAKAEDEFESDETRSASLEDAADTSAQEDAPISDALKDLL